MRTAALAALIASLGLTLPATADARSTLGRLDDAGIDESFDRHDPLRWERSHGWSNGDPFRCEWTGANAVVKRGTLTLSLSERPTAKGGYGCAEYQTRKHYGFGRYSARIRAAREPGVVTSFLSFTGKPFGDQWDEIKMAVQGEDTHTLVLTYFVRGTVHNAATVPLPFDAAEGFHDYAFDWTPDGITWLVDGKPVHRVSGGRDEVPQAPGKIYLQVWTGEAPWIAPFHDPGHPVSAQVQRVRYEPAE